MTGTKKMLQVWSGWSLEVGVSRTENEEIACCYKFRIEQSGVLRKLVPPRALDDLMKKFWGS